ncbi:MAG TPA: beta-ketoacyl synthase N-terminal-like domain-containing protein [Candidatus Polarisedimenticolia bacterium]|nr:beta-ketoacyl synthase N-terminal-like domain-containing protein [Candidatus Polarisedimenticolia bacterium]
MSEGPRRVVLTGGGAVSPFGLGIGPLLEGLIAGRTAVRGSAEPDGAAREGAAGGGTPGPTARVRDPLAAGAYDPNSWRRLDRCSRMAVLSAAQALAEAGAAEDAGIGVVLGTMTSGGEPLTDYLTTLVREGPQAVSPMLFPFTVPNAPASQCSILLGLKGPNLTLCQMEASGLGAIATAAALIRNGAADVLLAGGADEHPRALGEAWRRWRILARGGPGGSPGPFDRRARGFAPGEGAYVVLLETEERARARGVRVWAEVAGAATAHAQGAAHRWPSDASEPARAISQALSRAGLLPADLGYVMAGANGAREVDRIEARSFLEAFGRVTRRIPVSGVKGAVGESGAGSACGALVAALSIRDGFVPPLAGPADPDPDLGLNLVVGTARHGPVGSVLVNALATGGTCISLVLARPRA